MPHKRYYKDSKNALVLTGGGARAAYQVGVLSAIATFIPRNHSIPFPIICGTSAGAINSTGLACYASCFHLGIKKLEWVWKNLHTHRIYHSDTMRVFGHILQGILASFQSAHANKNPRSLLNNAPLKKLLNEVMDLPRIDKNIARGCLSAVSVTASSYTNGDSISFYQSDDSIHSWVRANRRGTPTQITTDHLMASAAIPMVFPSKKIQQEHYGDGSIHQLSPLSPAIHLGAKKIFVIGVEQPKIKNVSKSNNPHPPTTSTIAGHLLDGIFSDTLQSDIERMKRINSTIALIPTQNSSHQQLLRNIDSFTLNPSHDFNSIAVENYQELPYSIRLLLRCVGISNDAESSLISYLLFEKQYCQRLINLGYQDAMEKEQAIRSFLDL